MKPADRAKALAERFPLVSVSYGMTRQEITTAQRASDLRRVAAALRESVGPDGSSAIEKICRVERLAAELVEWSKETV